jgi:hypothetical protein
MMKAFNIALKDKTQITGDKIRFDRKHNLLILTERVETKEKQLDGSIKVLKVIVYSQYIPLENINYWSTVEEEK